MDLLYLTNSFNYYAAISKPMASGLNKDGFDNNQE